MAKSVYEEVVKIVDDRLGIGDGTRQDLHASSALSGAPGPGSGVEGGLAAVSALLAQVVPQWFRGPGLDVLPTDPPTLKVRVTPSAFGAGVVAAGRVHELDQEVVVDFSDVAASGGVWYVMLSGGRVYRSIHIDSEGAVLAKVVLKPGSTRILSQAPAAEAQTDPRQGEVDTVSADGYIVSAKDPLFFEGSVIWDEPTMSALKDALTTVHADVVYGTLTLSDNLTIENVEGTMKATSSSMTFYDIEGNVLAEFGRDRAFVGNIEVVPSAIRSRNFVTGSSGFQIQDTGEAEFNEVTVRGTIHAAEGDIAGWTITDTALTKNDATLSSTGYLELGTGDNIVRADSQHDTYRLWVGAATATDAPFRVDKTGSMHAENAYFSGTVWADSGSIGGWSIVSDALTSANVRIDSAAEYITLGSGTDVIRLDAQDASYRIWVGNTDPANADFRVSKSGALDASNAHVSGTITATAGSVGGWTIISTALYKGDVRLDSQYEYISVGSGTDVVRLDAQNTNYRLWAGATDPASAPFSVTTGGSLSATNASIEGTITATGGYIDNLTVRGTLNVDTGQITSGNVTLDSTGMTATGDDVSIDLSDATDHLWLSTTDPWLAVGGTDRATAPFRVTKAGALTASNANVTGTVTATSGELQTLSITGTLTIQSGGQIAAGDLTIDNTGFTATGSSANIELGSTDKLWLNATDGIAVGGTDKATAPFRVDMAGNLVATSATIGGEINADTGTIGGWDIGTSTISSGGTNVVLDSSAKKIYVNSGTFGSAGIQLDYNSGTPRFYAGNGSDRYINFDGTNLSWKGANTELTTGGTFTASNADITGKITSQEGEIGGWTIGASTLVGGSVTLDSAGKVTVGTGNDVAILDSTDTTYRIWAGNASASSAPFRVSKAGAITATSGEIGGWSIAASTLTGGSVVLDSANEKITAGDVSILGASSTIQLGASGINLYGTTKRIETADFQSGVRGWRIDTDVAEFYNIVARGEFHTAVFKKDTINATNGSVLISSATVLDADVSSSDTTITVREAVFSDGDVVALKTVSGSSSKYEKMHVTSGGGTTTLTVERGYDGTTAHDWETGTAIVKVEDRVLLTADMANGPYIDVIQGDGTDANDQVRVRIGNLAGIAGASGWGIWTDNGFFTGKVTATSGELQTLDVTGTLNVSTGGVLKSGASGFDSGTGWWLDYNGGTPRFFVGDSSGSKIKWDGSTLTLAGEGSGITNIDGGNIQAGTVTATQIAANTITANEIAAGTITGNEISSSATITAGSGDNVGVLDGADPTYRIYAGNASPSSAPFRVTQTGEATLTKATVQSSDGSTYVKIDSANNNLSFIENGTTQILIGSNVFSGNPGINVTNNSYLYLDGGSRIVAEGTTTSSPAVYASVDPSNTVGGIAYKAEIMTSSGSGGITHEGFYAYIDLSTGDSVGGVGFDAWVSSDGSTAVHGGYFYARKTGTSALGPPTGLYAEAEVTGSTDYAYGVKGKASGAATSNYGVRGEATSASGATAYGIYGEASGGGTNWAGYFAGPVKATGDVEISDATQYVHLTEANSNIADSYVGYFRRVLNDDGSTTSPISEIRSAEAYIQDNRSSVSGATTIALRAVAENNGSGNTVIGARGHASTNEDSNAWGFYATAYGSSGVGTAYGVHAYVKDGATHKAVYAFADNAETSYGVHAKASSSTGTAYGIYAEASGGGAATWAGYFSGNVNVTGDLSIGDDLDVTDHLHVGGNVQFNTTTEGNIYFGVRPEVGTKNRPVLTTNEIQLPPYRKNLDFPVGPILIKNKEMDNISDLSNVTQISVTSASGGSSSGTLTLSWVPDIDSIFNPTTGKEWAVLVIESIDPNYPEPNRSGAYLWTAKITGGSYSSKQINYTEVRDQKGWSASDLVGKHVALYNPFGSGWDWKSSPITQGSGVSSGAGSWRKTNAVPGGIFRRQSDGKWVMLVDGYNGSYHQIGVYESDDLWNWTVGNGDQPVFSPQSGISWIKNNLLLNCSPIRLSDRWYIVWLSGYNSSDGKWRVGYVLFNEDFSKVEYSSDIAVDPEPDGTYGYYKPSVVFWKGRYYMVLTNRKGAIDSTPWEVWMAVTDNPLSKFDTNAFTQPVVPLQYNNENNWRSSHMDDFHLFVWNGQLMMIASGTARWDESGVRGRRQHGILYWDEVDKVWRDDHRNPVFMNFLNAGSQSGGSTTIWPDYDWGCDHLGAHHMVVYNEDDGYLYDFHSMKNYSSETYKGVVGRYKLEDFKIY